MVWRAVSTFAGTVEEQQSVHSIHSMIATGRPSLSTYLGISAWIFQASSKVEISPVSTVSMGRKSQVPRSPDVSLQSCSMYGVAQNCKPPETKNSEETPGTKFVLPGKNKGWSMPHV